MTAPSIPTLMTHRLILRAPTEADFPAYAAFLSSARTRGMGGPYGTRAAWGLFCHEVAGWTLHGHGALMVDLRATGECVGQVGISHGPLYPEKELGWLIYDGHEGRGYAAEAATVLRDWAHEALGLDSLVSYVDPKNARSIALAERIGATVDPQALGQDPGDLVYRHRAGSGWGTPRC
ncbi:GNAT family N-acetyltransferase [Muricoccus aerilatus]|uniref:GNAT family N-acetyltransferase n=1 Tax=Muricoccus aerilatus TaxID=452982 RepID=UPI000AA6D94F|nr:GNAT family N-acetyltransferase [Roseomonas aerilata]